MCTREEEKKWTDLGCKCIIGIDESGAGPLAGPVTVCACYIPLSVEIKGINDSKKLTEKKRISLYDQLTKHPEVKYVVVNIDNETIDRINILQARFEGMTQAYELLNVLIQKELGLKVDCILIDGNQIPPKLKNVDIKVHTIIGGDGIATCIGAASIIAKTSHDYIMKEYDIKYPGYGFAKHKGYPSPQHKNAIQELGPTPIHRKTFRGVVVEK